MIIDNDAFNKSAIAKLCIGIVLGSTLTVASAQTISFDEEVKAGGVRCVAQGQDEKIYKSFYAGEGRYFVNASLTTEAKDGVGNCNFITDSPEPAVQTEKFQGTDQPVKYTVRACADCGNFFLPVSDMRQVCKFRANSVRGQK
ncbi:hypothetical protein [Massilia aquatica]|uniref:Uncharacterized protein n=1 Tax=Massilia aquatica TaxID=2609000 RepID=A0ABX0MCQ1_9BURK|nr:hypothetical protein [Massilia aquatica]NHZ44945.1 hypothetical protein [Massilia aquatica]